jgi:hypothetical protein
MDWLGRRAMDKAPMQIARNASVFDRRDHNGVIHNAVMQSSPFKKVFRGMSEKVSGLRAASSLDWISSRLKPC